MFLFCQLADASADEGIRLLADFTTSSPSFTKSNDLQQITNFMGTVLGKINGTVSEEFSQVCTCSTSFSIFDVWGLYNVEIRDCS